MAKKYQLPNWNKKDSQGICFLGKVKLVDFLKTKIPAKPGKIVDTQGKVLGQHQGTAFYTIGQRHGLNVGGLNAPYYVVKKIKKTNTLVIGLDQAKELFAKKLSVSNLSWVNQAPKIPGNYQAKIRYRQPDQKVRIAAKTKKEIKAVFLEPQRAPALGQSVVFYQGQKVLGGGVIENIA